MSDQALLADAVETFFAARCSHNVVEAIEAGQDARPLWDETEELGLTLAGVAEEAGGPGGTLLEALTVLEGAGRHAVPLPLAETSVLGGWLLAEAGLPLGEGPTTVAPMREQDLPRVLTTDGSRKLEGRALRVPFARDAERVVALARDEDDQLAVVVVPDPRALVVATGTNLAGEPRDTLDFTGVEVAEAEFGRADVDLDEYFLRGALARSVMMLGALQRARDLAVSYARDRSQFGRPIAKFQAVQHMLAEIARDVAVAEAAVRLAVASSEDVGANWLTIASAKVVAGRAAQTVSAKAHQVHGAIGMTKEYELSVLTRRLWCWREEFGAEADWSLRIGSAAWRADGGVWGLVTAGSDPVGAAGPERSEALGA
jgi:acyl-CoA dehydrogenase